MDPLTLLIYTADKSAGNSQHNVDRGVHCSESEREDWQLYQRLLSSLAIPFTFLLHGCGVMDSCVLPYSVEL